MDKKSLLIIVILILISSQLWNILWDIGKSALYIVILLLSLTYLSPTIAEDVRTVLKKIIALDYSLVSNTLSYISGFLLSAFGKLPKNITNLIQEESIIKFLCDYLSTGSTSLLFEVLRNKLGASYSNESDFNIFAEKNGMFYITCNVNNTLIEKSLIEILNILKNLKDSLISDEEIVKLKKIFDTTNLFQINNPSFIMKYHGKKYLYEKTDNIYDEMKYIKNINAKLINDLTNKLFQKKNLNIYIYGNELNQSNIAKIINDF
jgi:hypothetical protein